MAALRIPNAILRKHKFVRSPLSGNVADLLGDFESVGVQLILAKIPKLVSKPGRVLRARAMFSALAPLKPAPQERCFLQASPDLRPKVLQF